MSAVTAKPAGRRLDVVAVAHPDRLDRAEAAEEPAARDLHGRAAVLAPRRAADAPAEALRDPHHPVAEPEDRDSEIEELRVALRRPVVVDARGAAREDDPLRRQPRDLLRLRVERKDDRADPRLADPPGDDLRVLGAEVEDDDGVGGGVHAAEYTDGVALRQAAARAAAAINARGTADEAAHDERRPTTAAKAASDDEERPDVDAARQVAAVRDAVEGDAERERGRER